MADFSKICFDTFDTMVVVDMSNPAEWVALRKAKRKRGGVFVSRSKFFALVLVIMLVALLVFGGTASANVEQGIGGGNHHHHGGVAQSIG